MLFSRAMRVFRGSLLFAWLTGTWACGGSTTSGEQGTGSADAGIETTTGNDSDVDSDAAVCEEKTSAAGALLSAAMKQLPGDNLLCQTDDDCRVVWLSTDCTDNCSVLTSRAIAERIQAAIDEANATLCPGFQEAGCKRVVPPCAPPPPWGCVGGVCSIVQPSWPYPTEATQ
jgi:hypothetical protein